MTDQKKDPVATNDEALGTNDCASTKEAAVNGQAGTHKTTTTSRNPVSAQAHALGSAPKDTTRAARCTYLFDTHQRPTQTAPAPLPQRKPAALRESTIEDFKPPAPERNGAATAAHPLPQVRQLETLAGLFDEGNPDAADLIRRAVAKLAGDKSRLPSIESSAGIETEEIEEAPELIEGLLRSGEVMLFAADAKMGKTWLGIELAHAITCGGDWLGLRVLQRGAVLYLNFELQRNTFRTRLKVVCSQRGSAPDDILQLHLRGHESSVPEIAEHIRNACAEYGVKLIVIDSLYNTYGDRAENDNTDMGALMREVFAMARECGSALIALHHFSKSSGMAANDSARASGAHTLHRAPDNLTTATKLSADEVRKLGLTEECIHARVTPSLRSFRDMPPFIISRPVGSWQFNRAEKSLADMLAAAKAERSAEKPKTGPEQDLSVSDLCGWMGEKDWKPGELNKEAAAHFDVSVETVKRRKRAALDAGSIRKIPGGLLRSIFHRAPAKPAAVTQAALEMEADNAPTLED